MTYAMLDKQEQLLNLQSASRNINQRLTDAT